MSLSTSTLNSLNTGTATAKSAVDGATTAKEASERFLKLLVTQLQNQDPMNPVDNAQMTSQMAQISTVSGIEKLNTTVEGLNTQFVQMQAMQGAALVGKDVLLKGDKLSMVDNQPTGTFDLDSAATQVKVEVLTPAGVAVDTINMGPRTAGRQEFTWANPNQVADPSTYRFRVTATNQATTLATTTLMRDRVDAVNTSGNSLTLELERSGRVAYSTITAVD